MDLEELKQRVDTHGCLNFEEWVQYDLTKNTKSEVMEKYQLSTKKFNALVRQHGLQILYEYRTPYSKSLIPIDSELNKYAKKHAKEEMNKLHEECNPKNWLEKEVKERQDIISEKEWTLGTLCGTMSLYQEDIQKQLKGIAYQKFIIDVIKNLEPEDYIGLTLEEQFGTYEVPEKINENLITEQMIKAFVLQKYGLEKAMLVMKVLEG